MSKWIDSDSNNFEMRCAHDKYDSALIDDLFLYDYDNVYVRLKNTDNKIVFIDFERDPVRMNVWFSHNKRDDGSNLSDYVMKFCDGTEKEVYENSDPFSYRANC